MAVWGSRCMRPLWVLAALSFGLAALSQDTRLQTPASTRYEFITRQDYTMTTKVTRIYRYKDPLTIRGVIEVRPDDELQSRFKLKLELSRMEYSSTDATWTIDFSQKDWPQKVAKIQGEVARFYEQIQRGMTAENSGKEEILSWYASADLQYAALQIASTWNGAEMLVTRSDGGYTLTHDQAPKMTQLQELPSSHRVSPVYSFYLTQMSRLVLPPIVKQPSKDSWKKNGLMYTAWANKTELMLTGRIQHQGRCVVDEAYPFDHAKGFGWDRLTERITGLQGVLDLAEARDILRRFRTAEQETVGNRQASIAVFPDGKGSIDYVEEYALGITGLPNSSCIRANVRAKDQPFLILAWTAGIEGTVDYAYLFEAKAERCK